MLNIISTVLTQISSDFLLRSNLAAPFYFDLLRTNCTWKQSELQSDLWWSSRGMTSLSLTWPVSHLSFLMTIKKVDDVVQIKLCQCFLHSGLGLKKTYDKFCGWWESSKVESECYKVYSLNDQLPLPPLCSLCHCRAGPGRHHQEWRPPRRRLRLAGELEMTDDTMTHWHAQVKSDNGDFEYCKIICMNGQWRGPVCRLQVADITGQLDTAVTAVHCEPLWW